MVAPVDTRSAQAMPGGTPCPSGSAWTFNVTRLVPAEEPCNRGAGDHRGAGAGTVVAHDDVVQRKLDRGPLSGPIVGARSARVYVGRMLAGGRALHLHVHLHAAAGIRERSRSRYTRPLTRRELYRLGAGGLGEGRPDEYSR